MENNFIEEKGILIEVRAEGYVERCITATVHVYGDDISVHRVVVRRRPKRRGCNNCTAPVTTDVSCVNEVLVGGEEGRD